MKLIARIAAPLTITALALTGCSASTPTPDPTPTQSSAAQTTTPTPTTPTPSASPESPTPTTAPTTQPIPDRSPAPENAPTQLDTSGAVWSTMGQDTWVLEGYGIIEDDYYPLVGQPDQFCAVSDPTICTDVATRVSVMDALLSADTAEADVAGPVADMDDAPLREQDPYADLTDEELAELPVTGMP